MAINSTTTFDPTVTNDSSQGFAASSFWTNVTNGKVWVCTDATVGAAVWTLASSASPRSFATAAGATVGDNSLAHPLRTQGAVEPDMLTQMLLELKAIRMILGEALNVNLNSEDMQ